MELLAAKHISKSFGVVKALPYAEVGATVVTAENADNYYTSKYYESRNSKGFDEGAQDMKDPSLPGYWER